MNDLSNSDSKKFARFNDASDFDWPDLRSANTWVIKVGSSVLAEGQGISTDRIQTLCEQIVTLKNKQRRVVLVSSGAILEGCHRLGFNRRPHRLYELQAAAAVGQMGLMIQYEKHLAAKGWNTAVVLLTHDDISDRLRYLNARATLRDLLNRNVIPIVNENDTVATDEIEFGDNDTLAARIASLIDADVLVLLTDQNGLHESDPRIDITAPLVTRSHAFNEDLDSMVNSTPNISGRGGMKSKLEASRHAASTGCQTVIADGRRNDELAALAQGIPRGSLLTATVSPSVARKRWIAGQLRTKGEIQIDEGAVRALKSRGVSLLSVGVTKIRGEFRRGDFVSVINGNGLEIGKGIVNYGSSDARKIQGKPTEAIESTLGFVDEQELVHRDNLALTS